MTETRISSSSNISTSMNRKGYRKGLQHQIHTSNETTSGLDEDIGDHNNAFDVLSEGSCSPFDDCKDNMDTTRTQIPLNESSRSKFSVPHHGNVDEHGDKNKIENETSKSCNVFDDSLKICCMEENVVEESDADMVDRTFDVRKMQHQEGPETRTDSISTTTCSSGSNIVSSCTVSSSLFNGDDSARLSNMEACWNSHSSLFSNLDANPSLFSFFVSKEKQQEDQQQEPPDDDALSVSENSEFSDDALASLVSSKNAKDHDDCTVTTTSLTQTHPSPQSTKETAGIAELRPSSRSHLVCNKPNTFLLFDEPGHSDVKNKVIRFASKVETVIGEDEDFDEADLFDGARSDNARKGFASIGGSLSSGGGSMHPSQHVVGGARSIRNLIEEQSPSSSLFEGHDLYNNGGDYIYNDDDASIVSCNSEEERIEQGNNRIRRRLMLYVVGSAIASTFVSISNRLSRMYDTPDEVAADVVSDNASPGVEQVLKTVAGGDGINSGSAAAYSKASATSFAPTQMVANTSTSATASSVTTTSGVVTQVTQTMAMKAVSNFVGSATSISSTTVSKTTIGKGIIGIRTGTGCASIAAIPGGGTIKSVLITSVLGIAAIAGTSTLLVPTTDTLLAQQNFMLPCPHEDTDVQSEIIRFTLDIPPPENGSENIFGTETIQKNVLEDMFASVYNDLTDSGCNELFERRIDPGGVSLITFSDENNMLESQWKVTVTCWEECPEEPTFGATRKSESIGMGRRLQEATDTEQSGGVNEKTMPISKIEFRTLFEQGLRSLLAAHSTPFYNIKPSASSGGDSSNRSSDTPSYLPSSIPSAIIVVLPSFGPSRSPSDKPSDIPSNKQSSYPSDVPSGFPSTIPSARASLFPTRSLTEVPSVMPSNTPSMLPSFDPSGSPSVVPTNTPSVLPSLDPSGSPSEGPSEMKSSVSSSAPTSAPSTLRPFTPSGSPSIVTSGSPSGTHSLSPSEEPSIQSSKIPSRTPSELPSIVPSPIPSEPPTNIPSEIPSTGPSSVPSESPSYLPSRSPSQLPSKIPSTMPSRHPSGTPSKTPSVLSSETPSSIISESPSDSPSEVPSILPSANPLPMPSESPSDLPSGTPSGFPSKLSSSTPSSSETPSGIPSSMPSRKNSSMPSDIPSTLPSTIPTLAHSESPSNISSGTPSTLPSAAPSRIPSAKPSESPSDTLSGPPSYLPSRTPTLMPTLSPTDNLSGPPSEFASVTPSAVPSNNPTDTSSEAPSKLPSAIPSKFPSTKPTDVPTDQPSNTPTGTPTEQPSNTPTYTPTNTPKNTPTNSPTEQPSNTPTDTPILTLTGGTPTDDQSPTNSPTGSPTEQGCCSRYFDQCIETSECSVHTIDYCENQCVYSGVNGPGILYWLPSGGPTPSGCLKRYHTNCYGNSPPTPCCEPAVCVALTVTSSMCLHPDEIGNPLNGS